jgi:hypothetical protein
MESQVGVLALRVRTHADRSDAVRLEAERFTRRVLERCDALLETRAPARVLLMRSFDLSIRIAERRLGDWHEIEACARDVVDSVEQRAQAQTARAAEGSERDRDLVVFESDAQWRSAYVETLAAGTEPSEWYFEALRAEGPPLDLLATLETQALLRVLAVMDDRGSLLPMLAALTTPVLERLAARLGRGASPPDAIETTASQTLEERLATLRPSARPGEVWVQLAVTDYRQHGTVSSGTQPSRSIFECAYGGVFYFLSLVAELSIAEALWRACCPEAPFLAAIARALIGSCAPDSIEVRTFGGDASHAAQAVSREQHQEIASTVLVALVDALPRRGLSAWPEVCVRLIAVPAGRLIVAQDMLTLQVVFAAPAGDPDETVGALEFFLGAWPLSAPAPRAERGLVTLDRRGRLRPLAAARVADPLIVEGTTIDDTAVLTHATGSLAQVFLARVGIDAGTDPAAALRHLLAIPASLVFEADTLTVRLSSDHLDIRVRRAGLDRDPGWIPWLQRRVRFEYVDPSPGASSRTP